MADEIAAADDVQGGLTDADKRANVIRCAFGDDPARFDAFVQAVRDEVPAGTTVVLRGSAVTGRRWHDCAPFDSDGPGTSDMDLTLVGAEAVGLFSLTGFFVRRHDLAKPEANVTSQQLLAVLRDPHQMELDVKASVRCSPVVFHPSVILRRVA